MRTRFAALLILLVALFCVSAVPNARAAEKAAAPLIEGGTMRVMLYPGVDGSTTAVLVQYAIPSTDVLPARVRIPVPAHAHIGWVGEVAQETGPDTQRTYEVKNDGAGEYVEFTLTKSKTGQVDFSNLPLSNENGELGARMEWTQSSSAASTQFEVRLPATVHGVKISPKPKGAPDKNEYGETLYTLASHKMKIGDKETVSVSYKNGAGVGPVSLNYLLVVAAIILAVVAIVLITLALKRSNNRG